MPLQYQGFSIKVNPVCVLNNHLQIWTLETFYFLQNMNARKGLQFEYGVYGLFWPKDLPFLIWKPLRIFSSLSFIVTIPLIMILKL